MELMSEDLAWCVKRLPNDVVTVMKTFKSNVSVGGGFIRSCITGDELKDIDMFVNSVPTAETISGMIPCDNSKPFKTHNAYTLFRNGKPNVQIIFRWLYPKPQDVILDLDFTICCAVIWYDNGKFNSRIDHRFYQDLAAKRLVYTCPERNEDAGGSLIRVLKYYKKGYRITLDSYAKVIARMLSGFEPCDWEKWKSLDNGYTQEMHISKVVLGLLLEVDPNSVRESQAVLGAETLEDQEDTNV